MHMDSNKYIDKETSYFVAAAMFLVGIKIGIFIEDSSWRNYLRERSTSYHATESFLHQKESVLIEKVEKE